MALKKVGPTILDFFASATGANGLATSIGNGVRTAREKINKPIDEAIKQIANAGKKLLGKKLPSGVGDPNDYQGLVGNVVTWEAGGEIHRLWSTVDANGKATIWVASDKKEIHALIDAWRADWKGVPEIQNYLGDLNSPDKLPSIEKELTVEAKIELNIRNIVGTLSKPSKRTPEETAKLQSELRKTLNERANEVKKFIDLVGNVSTPKTLPATIKLIQEVDSYKIGKIKTFDDGSALQINGPKGYSWWWFKPTGDSFRDGNVRYSAYIDGTNNVGNPILASVLKYAKEWDNLPATTNQQPSRIKATSGRINAITDCLDTVNGLYIKYNIQPLSYSDFMNGSNFPELERAPQADSNSFIAAIKVAYTQRASAKGDYIHKNLGIELENQDKTLYYRNQGIDILSTKYNIWFEVQKLDRWEQHSKGEFLTQIWRELEH